MANFQDVLNKPATDVKPPEPLPPGTYLCIVDGPGEFAKIGQKQTDCINWKLKPMQAQPDVDQAALTQALQGKTLQEKMIRHRSFITEESVWRLKEFLAHLGVEEGSKTLGEMLPEAPGRQVLVTVGHRASEDGTQVFQEVKSTAKV